MIETSVSTLHSTAHINFCLTTFLVLIESLRRTRHMLLNRPRSTTVTIDVYRGEKTSFLESGGA